MFRSHGVAIAALCGLGLWTAVGTARADRPAPGAATPDRLKLPSGPSSVRGLADEPSVDPFSAQLDYHVPIELPGGFGNLAPALALTYSGSLGNGPMGIGWTLSQPRIQRSVRLGVPRFDDTDVLEISGIVSGRLVAIGNGEYRVEGMGQTVRVKAVATGGFEVDDGKGVHFRLGTSAASRQETSPTRTLAWLVEQQTNTMGEQIDYSYSHDQNQIYLTGITWGPAAIYHVTLAYEPRTDRTSSYRGGFRVVTAQRLAAITTSVGGTVRRAYQLTYDATLPHDVTLPVARLSGLTSTGVAGEGSWPALTFTYAAPAAAQITAIDGIGTWRLNANGVTLADLDGDGAADLLQLAASGHSYLTNQNGTFGGLQTLTGNSLPLASLQLQDLDGDSRPELLQDTGNGWSVSKFSKTRWVAQAGLWPGSSGLALKDPATTRFADLNGDGIADGIQWNNDGLKVHFATATGLLPSRSVERIGGTALPTAAGRFHDVNGDGLDDYLVIAIDHFEVFLGHGDGTFDPMSRVEFPFGGTIADPQDIELADLDRDGLIDLVKIETGTVLWFRGTPDGTFQTQAMTLANPEPLSASVVVAIADINGNGSQDVVWSSASGMWKMDLAGTTTAGMLTEVTNGLGMDVTVEYQSSHALSAAARAAGVPWSSEVPIAMPVPVTKRTALGPGEITREVKYSVRDGFWDATEQRFGGFLVATVLTTGATAAGTSSVNTSYSRGAGNNRELRGKPLVVQVFDGTGKRLSLVNNTWTTMVVSGLADTPLLRVPVLQETVTQHEDVTPIRKTDIKYTFDAFGRTNHVVDSGRVDVTGDEAIKDLTYADDDTTWVRDRLCEETVSTLDGTLVSDIQHLFGDNVTEEALFVIGKGWPRETRARLAGEARWVTQSLSSYDAHGNPVSVTSNGVERTFVYDANGLFPIEEHLTEPGHELIWRASWDPVLAVVSAITDPNGHTTHIHHDSLGRYTGEAIDDHPAHQIIEYDWSAPHPKTITWQFDGALADVAERPDVWSTGSHWRQAVDVANGAGETRYHALHRSEDQWIISGYHEVDANSRVTFAGRPVLSSELELSARPAGMVGDTLAYDPLGRVIEQALPTGAKRTYSYLAFERTTQEADLAAVHSVLDGQGRAILTERSLTDGTHEVVRASYDPLGRMTEMTLSGGTVTRTFTYDTLGRLTESKDPDIGTRTLSWDDANRLLSETNAVGQSVRYSYDGLGRLSTRDTGTVFRFHYDAARAGAAGTLSNLTGELAWVEEPTGGFDFGYDELGRVTFTRRRIDDQASELTTSYAASGLILGRSYDDGVALTYQYDPAGRLIKAGELWSLLYQDAMGQPLHERAGNGVDTVTARDSLGLPSEVTIQDANGAAAYHASATRNAWTAITTITDLDGTGLDHTATYTYDGFARLTGATLGTGAPGFTFGYAYDDLHNMTSRTASGPRALGAFLGTYVYGEAGGGPRQLTSIVDDTHQVTHRFGYDAAGRQTVQDQQAMTYDASDRLLRVDGVPGGSVAHAYGYDGARIKTTAPDGSVSYLFGDGTALRHGVREHDVEVGSRVVARISVPVATATRSATLGAILGIVMSLGGRVLGLAFLGMAFVLGCRRHRRRALAAATAGLALAASCSSSGVGGFRSQLSEGAIATFLHTGFGAGPALFTDGDGHVLEERRYEPFGVPVDAQIRTSTGNVVGPPDVVARDLNELNKRTDATTGWSDHGARWMVPETGRWLSTDPPVAAPDDKFMFAPWALHPYQYVHQNPVMYWDPDGRFIWFVAFVVVAVLVETEGAANAPTPTTPPERIIPSPTNADIAWGAAKVGTSMLGGAGAASLVSGTIVRGTLAGGTAAVIGQGVDDIHHGEFSGVGTYAQQALFGAATGTAFSALDVTLGPKAECPGGICPCFVAGTEITLADQVKPIEQVHVGDRVLPSSDRCDTTQLVDWVEVGLEMVGPDGDRFVVELLRQQAWVDATAAAVGGSIRVELDDLNVTGWAKVIHLRVHAPIASGTGCIVTGTIAHVSHDVISVALDGGAPPLEVTDRHRLYSATRNAWVAAGDLMPGEALTTRDGTIVVREIVREGHGPTPVYNLEVADGHRYYAGSRAILAHNQYTEGESSPRAVRRQAMRQAGIPTSQQPAAQKSVRAPGNQPAGRQYTYTVPAPGGGTRTMSVQHSLTDAVPGHGPHWEAGPVKPNGQSDSLGRPRLTSDKVKVDE